MKTMLIPIDFTRTTAHAVQYATKWAKAFGYDHIILLRSVEPGLLENIIGATEYSERREETKESEKKELHIISRKIYDELGPDIPALKVSISYNELPLTRAILLIEKTEAVQLVVVGTDHFSLFNNSEVSSQVIALARISSVRLLIVPVIYEWKSIHEILVPVDFRDLDALKRFENFTMNSGVLADKNLLLLNVDAVTHEAEEEILHTHLRNFKHQVFYSSYPDILGGIREFIQAHPVDLIVALPGRHSFLYALTHKSITKALYSNSSTPVLILK